MDVWMSEWMCLWATDTLLFVCFVSLSYFHALSLANHPLLLSSGTMVFIFFNDRPIHSDLFNRNRKKIGWQSGTAVTFHTSSYTWPWADTEQIELSIWWGRRRFTPWVHISLPSPSFHSLAMQQYCPRITLAVQQTFQTEFQPNTWPHVHMKIEGGGGQN